MVGGRVRDRGGRRQWAWVSQGHVPFLPGFRRLSIISQSVPHFVACMLRSKLRERDEFCWSNPGLDPNSQQFTDNEPN